MSDEILSRVRQLAADLFELSVEDLGADSSPQSIEKWDSMGHLNLVLAVEQEFSLGGFTPEEIESMSSLGAVAQKVREKLTR